MAIWPAYGPIIFGVVTAVTFFVPGLKYHRQRLRTLQARATELDGDSSAHAISSTLKEVVS